MHVQHATYGHPRPPCSRRGCVFPYDLVRPGTGCWRSSATHCALQPRHAPALAVPSPGAPCSDGEVTTAARHDRLTQRAALDSRDTAGLLFAAEMYGLQLDQLAELLGCTTRQARALAARWASRGLADSAVLSTGPPWVWLTRSGLQTCGLKYAAAPPALARLAHIRAVTAARLALQAVPGYRDGGAHWRSERHLRARLGGLRGARYHLPDAEVHWPEDPASGTPPDWAGECWAIEAELTPKTVARTIAIMRELLARTGDYGCPAAEARVAGEPPRHVRAIYLCSPAATGTVLRAREALGSLSARVEVRALPAAAYLPARTPA